MCTYKKLSPNKQYISDTNDFTESITPTNLLGPDKTKYKSLYLSISHFVVIIVMFDSKC